MIRIGALRSTSIGQSNTSTLVNRRTSLETTWFVVVTATNVRQVQPQSDSMG